VNFQGPCAHSKPSLRQRHEAKFTFLTPGVVLIFSFPPGNQTWLAGKSLTKWKLYREIIHKWSILHCNVWLYRKALKPLLGLLVLSLCQPPGQFHLFARCFFWFSSSPNGWRKAGNTGHAWDWKRHVHVHPHII
jgi:hypothetical protein